MKRAKFILLLVVFFINCSTLNTISVLHKTNYYYKVNIVKENSKLATQLHSYFKLSDLTTEQFDTIISICNTEFSRDIDIILITIFRESSFNSKAQSSISSARGLGQFLKCTAEYHKLDYNRLFDYKYATRGIIKRYMDIISKFGEISDIDLILAYGSYDRLRRPQLYQEQMQAMTELYHRKEYSFKINIR